MNAALVLSLGVSLALTLLIELAFALLWGVRRKKDLLLVALVNVLTNPVVVMLHYLLVHMLSPAAGRLSVLPLELFAVAAEAYYYSRYGLEIKRPVLFSCCANAVSYFTGALISSLP